MKNIHGVKIYTVSISRSRNLHGQKDTETNIIHGIEIHGAESAHQIKTPFAILACPDHGPDAVMGTLTILISALTLVTILLLVIPVANR